MAHAHTNRLSKETSPYLLQHAHNPVDWFPWGDEAFAKARGEDKPVLLSIGYSACHWCHVMERESFENEAIAAQMNASFVCIKVDREERPDVDQLYQGVVQLMRRGGGWPLTVFLTPDLRPFFGGTYFPPSDRFGLPGFPKLLDAIAQGWKTKRAELLESAEEFEQGLSMLMRYGLDAKGGSFTGQDVLKAGERLAQDIDTVHGGFGGAPKFPNPMNLAAMLRAHRRGAKEALSRTTLTLDRMATGGVYDQLGGGFHRYSVDQHWAVPHFEKMLYDNAQLVHLYTEGFQLTKSALYEKVVAETVEYLRREMTSPEGAFYSSQDADSEGVEGKFFVFTREQAEALLGAEASLVCDHLGITARGNFEHGATVLHVAKTAEALANETGRPLAEIDRILGEGKATLFAAREKRVRPGRDDKILTGWNGLAIRGLAFAARVFRRPEWAKAAAKAADFLLAKMKSGDRLLRTYKDGRAHIDGLLEDYGNFAEGLTALYQATFEPKYLEAALALAKKALELFWDDAAQAFTAGPRDGEKLVTTVYALHDNAWPSGASTLANALVSLAGLTSDAALLEAAEKYLSRMRDEAVANPFGYGHMLCAADALVEGAATLVVSGAGPEAERLVEVAAQRYTPALSVAHSGDVAAAVLSKTLDGKAKVNGKAAAYLCRRFACERPMTDAVELERALGGA